MGHHHEDFRLHTPDFRELNRRLDRRHFLAKTSLGLGSLALGSLLGLVSCWPTPTQSLPQP
ncbi:MAG: twin-arginine translocation signal domain-containing protein [Spirosomataceae bacterium]